VDNEASCGLKIEHGFSVLLESSEGRILFDCGQGPILWENASTLGFPLDDLNALVLSHGHFDHGGNLARLASKNPAIALWAHRDILQNRWVIRQGNAPRSIGLTVKNRKAISVPQSDLENPLKGYSKNNSLWGRQKLRWIPLDDSREILPGVWAITAIPRKYPTSPEGHFLDIQGNRQDPVDDDLSLLITHPKGDLLLCGCCHSGLRNTLEEIKRLNLHGNLKRIMGGFHLSKAKDEELTVLGEYLKEFKLDKIICNHCTGNHAVTHWKTMELPAELGKSGETINLN
jgi:7,8-dihydropterin-6-yl-methyl-4-(beta-D-ribofuranosyl)aminobenzene 5'-phosphate synthase